MEVCSQNVGKTDAGAFTGGTDREFRMPHLHAEIRILIHIYIYNIIYLINFNYSY